ncbi:MAG: MXAN_6640 family putative metalloprotease [Polyangiaceae bacterium]
MNRGSTPHRPGRPGVALASLLVASFVPRSASAQDCIHTRPTDPGGVNGYDYGAAEVRHHDGAYVRVFYAVSGTHAPNLDSVRSDGVPDSVALVASVTDDALVRFKGMGFREPISDGAYDACASNGGSGAFDVYLVRFAGADGVTVPEACKDVGKTTRCSGFIMVDATFARGYGSYAEGVRTVLPHETFHAIQNAYDLEVDRAWAEGSAQWAAKKLDPSLPDLERFLPAFFSEPSRSMDVPASGATASYLYGAAIWPVFLTQRHGDTIVRRALEIESDVGGGSVAAVGAALTELDAKLSLESELPTFAAWNASTGKRAGAGGYTDAAKYPMVKLGALGGEVSALTSGYGWAAYSLDLATDDVRVDVDLETDGTRNRALVVPLVDGRADVANAVPLPATNVGPALVVVAGVTSKKSDAPYVIRVSPHVEATPDGGTSASDARSSGPAADGGGGTTDAGGCNVWRSRARSSPGSALDAIALGFGVMVAFRRRRQPSSS